MGGYVGWYTLDHHYPIDQELVIQIAPNAAVRFVGGGVSGDGSPGNPYENIEDAITYAPDDATLIFKAGSLNTFSAEQLIIDRLLTLEGREIIIQSN